MTDDPDNVFFKKLLDLVPPQAYFTEEKKNIIRSQGEDGDEEAPTGKKAKKQRVDPFNHESVTNLQTTLNAMEEKIKGKKESKAKHKKEKATKSKVNVQELQEKLKARIAELQAKRAATLTEAEKQEQKRLERKQRRLGGRSKQKQKKAKSDTTATAANANSVPVMSGSAQKNKNTSRPIFNKEGKMVFSKFDFTESGEKDDGGKSGLVGKDYKRLLKKLEQRDEKVSKVKARDQEAGARLEEKHVWQDVLSKARGEKVKDDKHLLQKAVKHKEKMKEQRAKKWEQRTASVEQKQKQRQEKRQKNIQARKDAKKEKLKKRMIKKGRLLPGF
ncbi:hypothetical protein BaRGS_00039526 [Batillaria attramentaria]|uniref:Ribosomal RNA-processing protein 14/surfeit locus protein 6 C-terminal domain-containing protein n=1 Tax=Batillaria attramentaria TaxID=370345 RepID=A0ABD0J2V0_9CAEN|nr:hypothetical protein BaRGS_021599 [Batillaria attramentaria]